MADRRSIGPAAFVMHSVVAGTVVVMQRWVAAALRNATSPGHRIALAILHHEGGHVAGRHGFWRAAAAVGTVVVCFAATGALSPWFRFLVILAATVVTQVGVIRAQEKLADRRVRGAMGDEALNELRTFLASQEGRDLCWSGSEDSIDHRRAES